jgi:hypothetical protein
VQELAAAEEDGKTTAIMFTHLQEQHESQLKLMAAANKQAMDTIKALRHLHRGVQTLRHCPYGPNRRVPDHIATRLLVHHGGHPSGCKLYLLQINEEQN